MQVGITSSLELAAALARDAPVTINQRLKEAGERVFSKDVVDMFQLLLLGGGGGGGEGKSG